MLAEAFWRSIQEAPDDDAPRLIYADWLEENGGAGGAARAEFIRVQCEQARLGDDAPPARARELRVRERALWKKHSKAWLAPLKPFSTKLSFARGFPDQVLVHGKTFLDNAEAVLSAAPVFSVRLRNSKEQITEISRCPHLERLISLSLYWNHIGMKRAVEVFASPHLHRLSELDIDDNAILTGGLKALLSANLPQLTTLGLRANKLGDAGVAVLAEAPLLGQLRSLSLCHNGLTDAGVAALVSSPRLANLTHLDLGQNLLVGDGGAAALAASPHLRGLTSLSLGLGHLWPAEAMYRTTGVAAEGARALAASPHLSGLTHLDLSGQGLLGDAGVKALAASSRLTGLRSLNLELCNVSTEGLAALADAPFRDALTELNLRYARPGTPGDLVRALGPNLRRLTLGHHGSLLDADGVAALAASPALANLRELTLTSWCGPEAAAALAASPHLANLTRLDLSHSNIMTEGAQALARSPYLQHLGELRFHYNLGEALTGHEAGIRALKERFGAEVCVATSTVIPR